MSTRYKIVQKVVPNLNIPYLRITGTLESDPILGGGFDFRYRSGSRATVLQFFSSLTSSQSLNGKIIIGLTNSSSIYLNVITAL